MNSSARIKITSYISHLTFFCCFLFFIFNCSGGSGSDLIDFEESTGGEYTDLYVDDDTNSHASITNHTYSTNTGLTQQNIEVQKNNDVVSLSNITISNTDIEVSNELKISPDFSDYSNDITDIYEISNTNATNFVAVSTNEKFVYKANLSNEKKLVFIPEWLKGGWSLYLDKKEKITNLNGNNENNSNSYIFVENTLLFVYQNLFGQPHLNDISAFLERSRFSFEEKLDEPEKTYKIILKERNSNKANQIYYFKLISEDKVSFILIKEKELEDFDNSSFNDEVRDVDVFTRLSPILSKKRYKEVLGSQKYTWLHGEWVSQNNKLYELFSADKKQSKSKKNKDNKKFFSIILDNIKVNNFYVMDNIWGKKSLAILLEDNYKVFTFKKISENKAYVYLNQFTSDSISSDRKVLYKTTRTVNFENVNYSGKWSLIHTNEIKSPNNNDKTPPKKLDNEKSLIRNIHFSSDGIFYNNSTNSLVNQSYKFYQQFQSKKEYSFFIVKDNIEHHFSFIVQESNKDIALSKQIVNGITTINYYQKEL